MPQYGPSRAQWLGDADGRPGFVAGALQFRRASSEKSLTHYNVYWHRAAALAAPQGTDAAEETTGFLGKVGLKPREGRVVGGKRGVKVRLASLGRLGGMLWGGDVN